ncbi:MAG: hypothetical protein ABIQ35_13265 [Verrucomicrobiota bacterium]
MKTPSQRYFFEPEGSVASFFESEEVAEIVVIKCLERLFITLRVPPAFSAIQFDVFTGDCLLQLITFQSSNDLADAKTSLSHLHFAFRCI